MQLATSTVEADRRVITGSLISIPACYTKHQYVFVPKEVGEQIPTNSYKWHI